MSLPYPKNDLLFVEKDIYKWKIKDELSLAYYYSGRYADAWKLGNDLLKIKRLPEDHLTRIKENMKFFEEKING